MVPSLQVLAVVFVVLLVVFRLLELLRPRDKRLRLMRRGFWTDLAYFAFTPLVTKIISRIVFIAVLIPFCFFVYGNVDMALLTSGFGPAARLPYWLQGFVSLVIIDFTGYWMHRLFHGRRLWKFHAIHHSSIDLDWLSGVRTHPVNGLVMRIAGTIPVLALGLAPVALVAVAPILTLLTIVVHANVDWDWGPLRTVIISPCYHRWHHTDESEACNKNFAGFFPVWDIMFGTYYMPKNRVPAVFGTETPVPENLPGQLLFPFRREKDAVSAKTVMSKGRDT